MFANFYILSNYNYIIYLLFIIIFYIIILLFIFFNVLWNPWFYVKYRSLIFYLITFNNNITKWIKNLSLTNNDITIKRDGSKKLDSNSVE